MVGGDHMNGAGGYSGGLGEACTDETIVTNGIFLHEPAIHSGCPSGGSYYSSSMYDARYWGEQNGGKIRGQGGLRKTNQSVFFNFDSGGDGEKAGNGGTVTVSSSATIIAYNGNMITDGDYSNAYEYDKDGNQVKKLSAITSNGRTFIPAIIYAQNGVLRNVYKNNNWWGVWEERSYEYFKSIIGDEQLDSGVKDIVANTSYADTVNYCIRPEIIENLEENPNLVIKSGYINPEDGSTQGVGSGAGYIEVSNGTYTVN